MALPAVGMVLGAGWQAYGMGSPEDTLRRPLGLPGVLPACGISLHCPVLVLSCLWVIPPSVSSEE